MLKYVLGLAVILTGLYFYPQIASSTGGPCQALESRMLAELPASVTDNSPFAMFAGVMSNFTNGEVGEAMVANKYPNLPEPLGCAIGYYTFDKDDIEF